MSASASGNKDPGLKRLEALVARANARAVPVPPSDSDAVIFTDSTTSIESNRSANQSPTAAGHVGTTNLGSDTTGLTTGVTNDYATIGGGDQNDASGIYATVPGGRGNTASNNSSFAEGLNTTASGSAAHAEGDATVASGAQSHAEGSNSQAQGAGSHCEGANGQAQGIASHAEGANCLAGDDNAHAEGVLCQATANAAHAEGNTTQANGFYSHSEGNQGIANGFGAHVEGALGTANGPASHCEGGNCTTTGFGSHAEGEFCVANGDNSHAQGENAFADRETQFAIGGGGVTPATAASAQQTSVMCFRGSTPGLAANETVTLEFGGPGSDSPTTGFVLVDGKGYTVSVEASARSATGGIHVRSLCRRASVRRDAGAVVVAAQEALSSFGDAFFLTATLDQIGVGGSLAISFGTGAGVTAATRIVARVTFTETN